MTKFNKSLLTAAVVGVLAIPSLASAAELKYGTSKQITFAKDLIVNDDTTIYTPRELTLYASSNDTANIQTVGAAAPRVGNQVRVKVTLTNGARFDTTADATTLVEGFKIGGHLGGDGNVLDGNLNDTIVGTPYYSTSGQELNFTVETGADAAYAPGDFAVELNSMQVTKLVAGLFNGDEIGAEITVQNEAGQQILASKATIAQSKWGLEYASLPQLGMFSPYRIDVVAGGTGATAFNRKTRFSATGAVGDATNATVLWSPGGVKIDVAKELETDDATSSYINNYSAVAAVPYFNVVSTAAIKVVVTGTNLDAFKASGSPAVQNTWLSTSNTCAPASVTHSNTSPVVVNGPTISYTIPGNHAAVLSTIGKASPAPLNLYVCLQANTTREMVAQPLAGTVNVAYNLTTQRVDPPGGKFALEPLLQNGTEIVFQNVNPAGNATAQSFLRLTNNNAFACPIVIDAKDDAGKHSGQVSLTLAAHQSKQLNSEVLEGAAAAAGVTGGFGDGTGKWYVRVLAECDYVVASALNRHQDGVVTNLTPQVSNYNTWLTPNEKL